MSARTVLSPWSVSLRELLLLVALVGLACVSLKFANDWFWIGLSTAAMLLFMAAMVVAFIDRGSRQAFAIGFVLCAGMYAAAVALAAAKNGREFDPYAGSLPTTKLMRWPFEKMVLVEYLVMDANMQYDQSMRFRTPQEAATYRATLGLPNMMGGMGGGFGGGGFPGGVSGTETPMREDFLGVAHIWWGLLLGYCGGRFAKLVYVRREQRSPDTSAA
ncbi:MAG: hypothetical protein SGJ19_08945 [Planctomycetia bacterium]|nr:hypothetical protein [Planctomycetia bacterium]